VKEPTIHQLRCLGALAARHRQLPKIPFFSRWEIGSVVYGRCQGVQLKAMTTIWRMGLAQPDVVAAVDLVGDGICRCGCDRWAITDKGKQKLIDARVKVPALPVFKPNQHGPFNDPADWWKGE
jgi:hypothetical protein